jgi:tetratricopeptide (TPR) repeat protein
LARAGKRAGWLDWVEGLRRAGKVELAWKKAEAWRELDPLNLGVYRLAGELASAAGKVEEAREAFWDIVELAPHQPEALRLTGAMFLRAGDQEEAAHLYRLAHRARPADPCYGLELAELLIDQKKHNRALQILGGIESLYSGRQPLLAVRAKRLLDELASKRAGRRRVRAIRQLRRMLRLALPDDVPLVMSLEWDPLLGPLELAVITPDGRRISRARSWGRYGERFHSACHAMSSIRIPQPQKGTYRVEASLPADYGDRVVEGKLRIQTNKGRRSKRQAVSFRLERAATAETIARIIAR